MRSLSPPTKQANDNGPCSLASLARASNSIVAAPSQAQPEVQAHAQVQMQAQAQEQTQEQAQEQAWVAPSVLASNKITTPRRGVSSGGQDDGVMRLGSPLRDWHFERAIFSVPKPESNSNAGPELPVCHPVTPVARKLKASVVVPVDVLRSVTPPPPAMLSRAASAGAVVGRPLVSGANSIGAASSVPEGAACVPRPPVGGAGSVGAISWAPQVASSFPHRIPNEPPSVASNLDRAAFKKDIGTTAPQGGHSQPVNQWQQGPRIVAPIQSPELKANREIMPGPLVMGWQQAFRVARTSAGNMSPWAGAPPVMCFPALAPKTTN